MVGVTVIVVSAVLIVIALVLLEFKDLKHRLLLVCVLAFFTFILASLGYVYFTNEVNVRSFEGILDVGKLYFSWLDAFFVNLGKVTTFAVRQDWTGNGTIIPGK